MGVGQLRLMKHTTNDGRRMVLRNDMGKVKVPATKDIYFSDHCIQAMFRITLFLDRLSSARPRLLPQSLKSHCECLNFTAALLVQVILNAAVYEGMEVTKKKNMIEFIANVAGDGPTLFMLKVTKDEIDNLHTRVKELVPSS